MSLIKIYEEQQKIEKAQERLDNRADKNREKMQGYTHAQSEVLSEEGRLFRVVRDHGYYSWRVEEIEVR